MTKHSLSYVITFFDNNNTELWSGFVNAWPQNGGLQVDTQSTEPESIAALQQYQNNRFVWEPAWRVITPTPEASSSDQSIQT